MSSHVVHPDPAVCDLIAAAETRALEGARDDIRDRRREFVRLGADGQYLSALDDAWGLVSNRLRDLQARGVGHE